MNKLKIKKDIIVVSKKDIAQNTRFFKVVEVNRNGRVWLGEIATKVTPNLIGSATVVPLPKIPIGGLIKGIKKKIGKQEVIEVTSYLTTVIWDGKAIYGKNSPCKQFFKEKTNGCKTSTGVRFSVI